MNLLETVRWGRNWLMYPRYDPRNFSSSHNVAVFPSLGLVYNRIKKSGNTTITAFLSELEGHAFQSSDQLKRSVVLRPVAMTTAEVSRIRDYYSFTFVRDPYSRVLSAFLEKVAPGVQPKYAHCPGYGSATTEGFARFLDHLERGALHDDRHWWPQVELLYKPPADFSFIGRLERLVDDMGRVLSAVGRDPALAATLHKPHAVSRHTTGASSQVDRLYDEPTRQVVQRLYARDFDAFGYPR